jgi:DNA/RNA-binding domain of Phe-tRNA-synthetase-like protein
MRFRLHEAVFRLGVRGVYFNIRGMRNVDSTYPDVHQLVADQLRRVPSSLESSDIIKGFSDLHARVSTKATKLRASSESLLMYFRARQGLPRINGIVDAYNAISVRSGVAVGAHDLRAVAGDIDLRLTCGDETFWPLGAKEAAKVPAGEYAYVDSGNEILCRLEVRQVEKTKITLESTDVFFIVQAHEQVPMAVIEAAAADLQHACLGLFGGRIEPLNNAVV